MKYFVLSIIMIFLYKNSYSQLNLEIKELIVSNITNQHSVKVIDEEIENGPYLHMICVIMNTSDSTINLHPSESNFNFNYNFKGEKYSFNIVALPFVDNEIMVLGSGKSVELSLGIHLLVGTSLLVEDKSDYTLEMLEILPTLKLVYGEKNITFKSSEINKVTII